jgi:hypothetical protein
MPNLIPTSKTNKYCFALSSSKYIIFFHLVHLTPHRPKNNPPTNPTPTTANDGEKNWEFGAPLMLDEATLPGSMVEVGAGLVLQR